MWARRFSRIQEQHVNMNRTIRQRMKIQQNGWWKNDWFLVLAVGRMQKLLGSHGTANTQAIHSLSILNGDPFSIN